MDLHLHLPLVLGMHLIHLIKVLRESKAEQKNWRRKREKNKDSLRSIFLLFSLTAVSLSVSLSIFLSKNICMIHALDFIFIFYFQVSLVGS